MTETIWFAIIAGICGGAALQQRMSGKPVVNKPLLVAMWIVAVAATILGVIAGLSG